MFPMNNLFFAEAPSLMPCSVLQSSYKTNFSGKGLYLVIVLYKCSEFFYLHKVSVAYCDKFSFIGIIFYLF